MATIVTRAGKGSPLTHNEVDANFENLNSDKVETSSVSAFGATLIDDADAATARTTLGLGSAATTDSTDYATAAQGALADSAVQPSDSPTFGSITVTGTVDGRDVAADGAKLDGIEAGATADQTASEILTAIKTVDGSGSGLDADLLDGQQGSYYLNTATAFGGDVSGTYDAIVVADDSHNHIIANVDGLQTALDAKLNLSGGTVTGNISVTGTVDGRDVSVDGTKLDGIEANADVTDAANVEPLVDTHLNTGTAAAGEVLSWTGTDYDWITAGGGGAALELYAENPSSPTAPSATGTNAVAIGTGAVASNSFATAVGSSTDATGSGSTAVGRLAQATGLSSNAFGLQANASGSYATALGRGSATSAVSAGSGSTAIGGSYASGTDSLAAAIANNTSSYGATGANSVAMGYLAKTTDSYGFSTGYQAQSTGNSAIAMGFQANAGSHGVALGYRGIATGLRSFGVNNTLYGATGTYSIAIGNVCLANSTASVAIGNGSQANAAGSVVLGSNGKAQGIENRYVFSPISMNGSNDGASQSGVFVLIGATTDATAKVLTTNDITAGTTNQIILPNNSAYAFHGTIVARQQASDGTACAAWKIEGLIRREGSAGTTVLVNSATTVLDNTPAWGMALSADTTNGGLKIEVTGAAATNIRWVATINTSEVTY